jgi:hypothetical protein
MFMALLPSTHGALVPIDGSGRTGVHLDALSPAFALADVNT